jgi:hypothetical protein
MKPLRRAVLSLAQPKKDEMRKPGIQESIKLVFDCSWFHGFLIKNPASLRIGVSRACDPRFGLSLEPDFGFIDGKI